VVGFVLLQKNLQPGKQKRKKLFFSCCVYNNDKRKLKFMSKEFLVLTKSFIVF
jgi:hypothetical protein